MTIKLDYDHTHDDIHNVSNELWSLFHVWTETDSIENECEIAPVIEYANEDAKSLDLPALYIASRFVMSDKSVWNGFIRYTAKLVTVNTIFDGSKRHGYMLNRNLRHLTQTNPQWFSARFDLEAEDVFPLVFCSIIQFGGEWITGSVDDKTHIQIPGSLT